MEWNLDNTTIIFKKEFNLTFKCHFWVNYNKKSFILIRLKNNGGSSEVQKLFTRIPKNTPFHEVSFYKTVYWQR